jgi:Fe-S oxidoreductase
MSKELLPPGLSYIADNILSRHNILGASKEQRSRWAKGFGMPKRAETILFAGCGYQFSGELEKLSSMIRQMDRSSLGSELPMRFAGFQKKLGINLGGILSKVGGSSEDDVRPLRAVVEVLQGFGLQFGYLAEDEPCCGAPLHQAGMQKEFADNARKAYEQLKSYGVKRIISVVPYCTQALSQEFPKCVPGFDIEVKHFLEIVVEHLAFCELRFPRQVKVTYHDSCQLSRYLGLIEEPRQILRAVQGIELVEPDWTKGEFSTCCGGGGGFEAVFPELSQILAVNRTKELLETGAEIIVTHCPGCEMQLKYALKELKKNDVEVLDLAEVLAMSLVK